MKTEDGTFKSRIILAHSLANTGIIAVMLLMIDSVFSEHSLFSISKPFFITMLLVAVVLVIIGLVFVLRATRLHRGLRSHIGHE